MTSPTRDASPLAALCDEHSANGRSRTHLEITDKITSLAALLDRSSIEPTQSAEDQKAFSWIWQSLEDIEATIIGLSRSEFSRLTDDGQLLPVAERKVSRSSPETLVQNPK